MKPILVKLLAAVVAGTPYHLALGQDRNSAEAAIHNYCQSMVQAGTDESEARTIIDDCLAEQRMYLDDYEPAATIAGDGSSADVYQYESDPESSASGPDCYQVADEEVQAQLERDPEATIDYEDLVDDCLNNG